MKKKYPSAAINGFTLLIFLFLANVTFGQKLNTSKNIDSSFINYAKLYQEVVHTHFNKSTYLIGESLGFTSYVINKKNNTPSLATKNLYCVITNDKDEIIKKKLLKVENGIASNVFEIDSLFTSGNYVFKAYTNWMLNFKHQNYFQEKFRVIDTDNDSFVKKTNSNSKIDLQFLPEGGHLIDNVMTKMGVIAKDILGNGIPNIKGKIFDNNNVFITSFNLNSLGIGRFSFSPKANKVYRAEFTHNEREYSIKIKNKINITGINLKIDRLRDDILVSITTNETTLKNILKGEYTIANYNNYKLEKIPFILSGKTTISKKISLKNILPGLSVFTLFDSENNPISERLFFNHRGLSFLKSSDINVLANKKDSVTLSLKYKSNDMFGNNNVSVSVLPVKTKSYNKNTNIISQTLIQPYIEGKIENPSYYFTDINARKKYDLDNLLLTQGWSSYDWNEIFKDTIHLKYGFEEGVNLKINIPNKNKQNKFLFHNSLNKLPQIVEVKKGVGSFNASGFYPLEGEDLFVSHLNKKGKLTPASLYLQYIPSRFSLLDSDTKNLLLKPDYFTSEDFMGHKIISETLKNTQKLEEIVLKVDLKKEKIEKIRRKSFGQVYFAEEENGLRYGNILTFLRTKGFVAERIPNSDEIYLVNNQASVSLRGNSTPIVFLNDLPLLDLKQLNYIDFTTIDYIDINKSGIGEGIRGAGGAIRIYTDPFKSRARSYKTRRAFKFPLAFSKSKKFYSPTYQSYKSNFYKFYGAIDWLPKNKINNSGILNLKFKNPQPNNVKIFIEGITEKGEFILEERTISLEK